MRCLPGPVSIDVRLPVLRVQPDVLAVNVCAHSALPVCFGYHPKPETLNPKP